MKPDPIRLKALSCLVAVVQDGVRPKTLLADCRSVDPRRVQEKLYGVLRRFWVFEVWLSFLLPKPLKPKDRDIQLILMLALHELEQGEPDYAVVDSAVNLVPRRKIWAKKLVNAVLRRWLREHAEIVARFASNVRVQTGLSDAQSRRLINSYGERASEIFEAMAVYPPPLGLRVALAHQSVSAYEHILREQGFNPQLIPGTSAGLYLDIPVAPSELPGWQKGEVAIQDGAAQLAAEWLNLKNLNNAKVLDACAAPGGKSGAIKNLFPAVQLTALERDPKRFRTLQANFKQWHLDQEIEAVCANIVDWAPSHCAEFDRVLVDVPCSSSGVMRRHPDIRLKSLDEMDRNTVWQLSILKSAWQTLKTGGELLYVTCSLFEEENDAIIQAFLNEISPDHGIPEVLPIDSPLGLPMKWGRQILPGGPFDGLYYARIAKKRA